MNKLIIPLLILFFNIHFLGSQEVVNENFQKPSMDLDWLLSLQTDEKQATEWLKAQFQSAKKEMGIASVKEKPATAKCQYGNEQEIDPRLLIFMSFSVPDSVWLSLSKEIQTYKGTFVLCGLPGNNFNELSHRLLSLKEKGMHAAVQIHPQLFKKYDIKEVPTFLIVDDNGYDKLTGNVSLEYSLTIMAEKGETSFAKKIREKK